MPLTKPSDVKRAFLSFVGLETWVPIAGRGTGTRTLFSFGPAIARTVPLKNPTLTEKNRLYEAEFRVFVAALSIDLVSETGARLNSWEQYDDYLHALPRLEGRIVDSVRLEDLVFSIAFKDGSAAHVDCALEEKDEEEEEAVGIRTPMQRLSIRDGVVFDREVI